MNFKIGKISTNEKTFYLHKIIFTFLHEINILKFKYLCWEKKLESESGTEIADSGSRIRTAIPVTNINVQVWILLEIKIFLFKRRYYLSICYLWFWHLLLVLQCGVVMKNCDSLKALPQQNSTAVAAKLLSHAELIKDALR